MRDIRRPPFYVQAGDKWISIPFEPIVSGPMNPILAALDFSSAERKIKERLK